MILMIDNYDSFTFNVVQCLSELGARVAVRRNDAIDADEADRLRPTGLVISPGPGTPADAGVSGKLVEHFAGRIPVLGICLGHQTIVSVFGGKITRADQVMHGKTSGVFHDGRTIYTGLGTPFVATRYHSLVVREVDLPDSLEICAYTEDGEIMGVRHREHAVEGVQFHPESIMTREGPQLLSNWLQTCRRGRRLAS